MEKEQVEKKAFNYITNGFHCAETIAKVLNEIFDESEDAEEISKYASAFGGGMGGTHEDVCGALAGALIFIGARKGRVKPGESLEEAMSITRKLRDEFIKQNSSTNCKDILEHFGPQENMLDCKLMVSKMSGIFAEIIEKETSSENWSMYADSSLN